MISLANLLQQAPAINEINARRDISTKIGLTDGIVTIRDYKLVLTYDAKQFLEKPDQYIQLQLQAHQDFHRELLEGIDQQQAALVELLNSERGLQSWIGYLPENVFRIMTKVYVAPAYALSGTSFEKGTARKIEAEEKKIQLYDLLKDCLHYGANFFDSLVPQKEIGTVEIAVGECVEEARRVAGLYSRLSCLSEQKLKLLRRERKFFFPEKKTIPPAASPSS